MNNLSLNKVITVLNDGSISDKEISFSADAKDVNIDKELQLDEALGILDSNVRRTYEKANALETRMTNLGSELPSLQLEDPGYSSSSRKLLGKLPENGVGKTINDFNLAGTSTFETVDGATYSFNTSTATSACGSNFYQANFVYNSAGIAAVRIKIDATKAQKIKLSGYINSARNATTSMGFYKINTSCAPTSGNYNSNNIMTSISASSNAHKYVEVEYDIPIGESFIEIKATKNSNNTYSYAYFRIGPAYQNFYCQIYNSRLNNSGNFNIGVYNSNTHSNTYFPVYINDEISSSTNKILPGGYYIAYFNAGNGYFNTDGTIPGLSESLQEVGDRIDNIHVDDATSTQAGVVKVRLDTNTNTLYMTNNGNNA